MVWQGVKVLVTGASGFTGKALVRSLCGEGAEVTAIARASSNLSSLAGLPIQWVRGEVFDPDTVNRAVAGVEYIFHVAAAYREAGISDDVYTKVHVTSTQLLAQAALLQPGFKRFLHVSTVGVHGHIEKPPADEESPFSPGDIYQNTKAEAELWIRSFAREKALSLAVIRPAAIYGPGDARLFKIFKMTKSPVFPLLGFGKCLYHLIHVEDLIACMKLAAQHPQAEGEAFICGNTEPMPLKDIIRTIGNTYGKVPVFIRFPAWPFFWLGYACEKIFPLLKREPPIYRRRVAFFTKDRAFNTAKIRDRLGFRHRYDNVTGLQETAEWYKRENWL